MCSFSLLIAKVPLQVTGYKCRIGPDYSTTVLCSGQWLLALAACLTGVLVLLIWLAGAEVGSPSLDPSDRPCWSLSQRASPASPRLL